MARPARNTLTDERGVTLVEVLAAVTILAVISVTIIGYFIAAMEKSADESRRIIASNLARLKTAELRQMVKQTDLDPSGQSNFKLMRALVNPPGSSVRLTEQNFLGGPFAVYGAMLEPTVINGTAYHYTVLLNSEGSSAARSDVLTGRMDGDSGKYLVPITVQVSWDSAAADPPRRGKMTMLNAYLTDRG